MDRKATLSDRRPFRPIVNTETSVPLISLENYEVVRREFLPRRWRPDPAAVRVPRSREDRKKEE